MDDDLKDSLPCGDGHLEGNHNQDGKLLNYDLFFLYDSSNQEKTHKKYYHIYLTEDLKTMIVL